MPYTEDRLEQILRDFREGRERDQAVKLAAKPQYSFRHQRPATNPKQVQPFTDPESEEEDDQEYDPSAKRKRPKINAAVDKLPAKRRKIEKTATTTTTNPDTSITTPFVDTTTPAERAANTDGFLTLLIVSDVGKEHFKALTEKFDAAIRTKMAFVEESQLLRTGRAVPKIPTARQQSHCKVCQEIEQHCSCSDGVNDSTARHQSSAEVPIGLTPQSTCSESTINQPHNSSSDTSESASAQNVTQTPPKETVVISDDDSTNLDSNIRPLTFHIDTFWAHPIDFKYHPKPGDSPCEFCADFRVGLWGLGLRNRVEVAEDLITRQYIEMGNGWRAEGFEETKMCYKCAIPRIRMVRCKNHRLMQIPGMTPNCINLRQWQQHILRGSDGSHPLHRVCSLCVNPAYFVCCAPQIRDKLGRLLQPGEVISGCGFYACNLCTSFLRDNGEIVNEGNMLKYVKQVHHTPTQHVSLRADVEFLYPKSRLIKAYEK